LKFAKPPTIILSVRRKIKIAFLCFFVADISRTSHNPALQCGGSAVFQQSGLAMAATVGMPISKPSSTSGASGVEVVVSSEKPRPRTAGTALERYQTRPAIILDVISLFISSTAAPAAPKAATRILASRESSDASSVSSSHQV
jgi:hypothetical protein